MSNDPADPSKAMAEQNRRRRRLNSARTFRDAVRLVNPARDQAMRSRFNLSEEDARPFLLEALIFMEKHHINQLTLTRGEGHKLNTRFE